MCPKKVDSRERIRIPNGIKFPGEYRQWMSHDIDQYRPDFYENVQGEHLPAIWRFIEDDYLSKYDEILLIGFEWCANGVWRIPFPGSVGMGQCWGPDSIGLPRDIADELNVWHDDIDRNCDPSVPDDFDWATSDRKGLAIAKRIKAFVGAKHYVEFNPFRELIIVDGQVVEADVPDFIRNLNAASTTRP